MTTTRQTQTVIRNERVAVYARVSSEEQAERDTVQAQLDYLRTYCGPSLNKLAVYDEYVDDGISGTLPLSKRPQGRRLLEDAASGKFGSILFTKVDRFGRKLTVILDDYEQLAALGVDIRSATEPIDTFTAIGRMVFQLLGVFAELERENIKERTSHGRDRVAKSGKYTGGRIPFGYDVDSEDKMLTASLRTVPALAITESDLVVDIFRRINEGETAYAVATYLNALAIEPERRYSKGKVATKTTPIVWTGTRIGQLIHSPIYKGDFRLRSRYGAVEYDVPALVPESDWHKAQAQLTRNRNLSKRADQRTYLLRGFIRCENCSSGYSGGASSSPRKAGGMYETRLYRCTGGQSAGRLAQRGERCTGKSIRADDLEAAIWLKCVEIIRNPGEHLAKAQQQIRERLAQSTDNEVTRQRLTVQLAGLDTERERVISMYKRGLIADSEMENQLTDTAAKRAALETELASLKNQAEITQLAEAHLQYRAAALSRLHQGIDSLEAMPDGAEKDAAKRERIELLVNRITVTTVGEGRERRADISASIGYDPAASISGVDRETA